MFTSIFNCFPGLVNEMRYTVAEVLPFCRIIFKQNHEWLHTGMDVLHNAQHSNSRGIEIGTLPYNFSLSLCESDVLGVSPVPRSC